MTAPTLTVPDAPRAGPARAATARRRALRGVYQASLLLACASMLMALGTIILGVVARQAGWDVPGLDAYAGYAIAAALFLALPDTLQHGDHIRVTLVLQRLPRRAARALELWSLVAGLGLAGCLAFFAARLVWMSYLTHDVSPSADATPLWIPQIAMALGCVGFTLAFAEALLAQWQGREFFAASGDTARVE